MTGHQAGSRSDRADRSRVGERDRCALKVSDLQFAGARAFDYVVVGVEEAGKIQRVRVLDIRHQQRSGAVFLFQIDCDSQIDRFSFQARRVAVDQVKTVVELRKLGQRPHDCPGDHMRVGSLAPAIVAQMAIHNAAIFVEKFYRNATLRSRSRHRQAGFHVLDDFECGTANWGGPDSFL